MDENLISNETLSARVKQLEQERDELHKDIEQLCMQQAGPAYLGVATRMHFQRTAGLEQEIENLKNKLVFCSRENQNIQEELSEAYRIKSQLADLHSAEVIKNIEAEKQLKFFQSCVASAFAERDTAIMEAEKAKEKVELVPQELIKCQRRIEELTSELLEERKLASTLQIDLEKQESQHKIFKEVVNKFYEIRQGSIENTMDESWENKCECLFSDSAEKWRFENDEETSTSNYISSLEAENETLRKGMDNLQNNLRVGLEIETHLKKKFRDLEKKKILFEKKIKKQIASLQHCHSEFRISIANLLDEGLKSIIDVVVENVGKSELNRDENSKSSLLQEMELSGTECRDVHVNADSGQESIAKDNYSGLPCSNTIGTCDTSEALTQALQEKVEALLLLSQEDERQLLERNVNAALQRKVEELQRNLLQVTNEKVKALMELAQLKHEHYVLQEKMSRDIIQGKHLNEFGEQRLVQEKDGKFKNFLRRNYLRRWVGGAEGNDAEANLNYEKPNSQMNFARMKIENATLKESLESMEHLISSIQRLRISLLKVKDSAVEKTANFNCFEFLNKIISEAKLLKIALGSSFPISWSGETDGSDNVVLDSGYEKVDFVSAAGFEMIELVIFAAEVLKDQISHEEDQGEGD